ncbi:hypothetical protein HRI_004912700 [Hibiscus trionum]|uniref:RRM domain-containing protein n=1 Tax=Hibiscus trionum TaxID=183268 RepID=A0A9W7JET0_HIBTR|nr:hypothetical protein HRI_004912700 [Hibiscus trionum]
MERKGERKWASKDDRSLEVDDGNWSTFIDNLSRRVPRTALWELFNHHGKVRKFFKPSVNRKPKYKDNTFAIVHFRSHEDMRKAIYD